MSFSSWKKIKVLPGFSPNKFSADPLSQTLLQQKVTNMVGHFRMAKAQGDSSGPRVPGNLKDFGS